MADLTAFVTVAEERNFTRAAAKLGLSQSALSQIVQRLEERLGVRLLARTTRSVAPTPAGERLVERLAPMLHDLDQGLTELSEFRDKRHTVMPGLTGLWQVSERSNAELDLQCQIDDFYIDNRSVWLDWHILLRTIPAVLGRGGAF